MSRELTTPNTRNNGGSESTLVKNRVKRHLNNAPPASISRRGLEKLHNQNTTTADLSNTVVGKGFNTGKEGLKESAASGLNIFTSGSKGLIEMVKQGGENKSIRSIFLGGIATVFGLKTLKGILEVPKRLANKNPDDKSAPFLLSAGKWVAGGSLALGAVKAFTSGAGISNPALGIGLVSFFALSLITSAYENETSAMAKILHMLGLKDKFKAIADDAKLDGLVSN